MTLKQKLLMTLFSILFLAFLFLGVRKKSQEQIVHPIFIRSIGETQQQLKDAGFYHGRIDYIWGPNTERAYCNYKAAQSWPKKEK